MNLRAIAIAIFMPLLLWTGVVTAVTLSGYPGVVCITPLAWLLAVPAGFRVAAESESSTRRTALEGLCAGAILGFWQGLLFAAAMAMSPYVSPATSQPPSPWLAAFVAVLLGVPLCAVLGALAAWYQKRKMNA